MLQHTCLLDAAAPAADTVAPRTLAPVLIQVPRLNSSSDRVVRARKPIRRGGRRLRREVRVAITAMAFAIPMSWAMLSFGKAGPEREKLAPIPAALASSVEGTPLATLSLDTLGSISTPEFEAPVALPAGYLVPDDRAEDLNHAGN